MIAEHKELGALSAFLSLEMSPLSIHAYQGQILSRHLHDDIYFIPVLVQTFAIYRWYLVKSGLK